MAGVLVATAGYAILLTPQQGSVSAGARYFALFLVVGGGYVAQPVTLAWLANNVSGHYKRSVASALQIGVGNCGGMVASNVFLQSERPRYATGYGVGLALVWVCGLACTVMYVGVRRENGRRDRGERDGRLVEGQEADDLDNMGDDHPAWRFTT